MKNIFENEWKYIASLLAEIEPEVLKIYNHDFKVDYKEDNEGPVTEADRLVNDFFREKIAKKFPHDGIISEETPDHSVLKNERVWIIDPIDGTKEFVKRNGEFSIMVGMAIGGNAEMGIVSWPIENIVFFGAKDWGCFCKKKGQLNKLECRRDEKYPFSSWTIAVSRSHHSKTVDKIIKHMNISKKLASGSIGLKLSKICTKEADIYIDAGSKTKEWDLCAPQALLHAAGGMVTDLYGKKYSFNRKCRKNERGVIATSGAEHEKVIQLIKEVLSL
ncbi:3'(2'),5'-bisphosphate nucleotidase CysQ [Candidatus Riflebacteria bacterium]